MRNIHPDLLDCLRRPNPYTELVTEISAPDTSDVLRRPDQFTGAKLVSQTPGGSLATSPRGPLQIASASTNIATFAGVGGSGDPFYLNREDANRRLKGVGWELDKAFVRAVLRTVTVKIYRNLAPDGVDFELQIFRVTKTPGLRYKANSTTGTPWNEYAFTPLLTPAAVIKAASIGWVANVATLAFDLTNHGLVIENTPEQAVSPDQVGELPKYYIVVRPVNMSKSMDRFGWYVDGATSQTVAGVGTFRRTYWARNSDQEQWSENIQPGTPNVTVAVEQFQAATEAVYALDLTRAPAAGTTGRVMFERLLPPGTAATLSISTAGSGGPWTAVKHGDVIGTAQQLYHLKVTLAADAALRSSPGVTAIGVEFRKTYDVSVESVLELPTREISLPWLEASIAEAKVRVLRLGIRDYLDVASTLGATESAAKLEVDIYLASRHPAITRDKWLRLERMLVTNRTPSANGEDFTLLSYASRLKKKIPEKKETISSTHVVAAGSTAAQLILATALPGASAGGNEYDNKRYYIRVQKTGVLDFAPGHVQEIAGNTGVDRLDFSPALPGVLVAGDVVEVHSGVYNTQVVTWADADFADIWWELLTAHIGIPPERIGHGSLPRGGKPPTVADRAPGNAAAQAKLKGTFRLAEQENGDEPIDQVSFHLGGATVEIDGQICFVQIYELRDPSGVVTVPLPPVSRVFDLRDYSGLAAAPGLEKRATVLSAQYGKNAAAANPDAYPEKTTVVIDNDAFAWLARTDLEDLGTTELPDKIRRWIYNSSDLGLQLATDEAHMVVRATSTGLRVWPFTLGDSQPELTIGDVVVIVTDQYTDYDPASVTALRGWLAVRGVVVRCGAAGRQLGIFVPGLTDNVTAIKGGQTGDISTLGDAPEKPTVTVAFNAAGQPTLNLDGRDLTASLKVDVDKVATPTDAEVEATAAIEGAGASVSILSPTWAPGEILYGKAFAYAGSGGTGRRSEATVFAVPREGTGTAERPRATITRVSGNSFAETIRYNGYNGAGQSGALTIERSLRSSPADAEVFQAVADNSTEVIVVDDGNDQIVNLRVVDAGGREVFSRPYTVRARIPESTRGATRRGAAARATSDAAQRRAGVGGTFTRQATFSTYGQYGRDGVRLLFNPDLERITSDLDGPTGIGMDVVERGGNKGDQALDASNIAVAAAVDLSRGYTNKHMGNIPDDATSDRKAVSTNEKTGASRAYPALDASNKLVTGVTSAATAADGLTGITSRRAAVRASGNATQGITAAGARRRGEGGTATSPFTVEPLYTRSGGEPMVDTLTERFKAGTIDSTVDMDRPTGTLGDCKQDVVGTARSLMKGVQSGTCRDGDTVTFSPAFENTPNVVFLPGGTTWHPDFVTTLNTYLERIAEGLSTTSFIARLRNRQPGTQTTRNDNFTSPTSVSTSGSALGAATTANAPSNNSNYEVKFRTTVVCTTPSEEPNGTTEMIVAIDYELDGTGSDWVEITTRSYTASRSVQGTTTSGPTSRSVSVSVAGLGTTSRFRARIKEINYTGGATGACTLAAQSATSGNDVTYATSSGDVVRTATPGTGDFVTYIAYEAVK